MNTNYAISPSELATFIRKKLQEFTQSPLLNINALTHVGMVLTAVGLVKGNNTLKILGDLLTEAPDRLRPLISLKYTLVGTIGELQATLNRVAEAALRELASILNNVANVIEKGEGKEKLADLAGQLYDLLVVRLPSVTLAVGGEASEMES